MLKNVELRETRDTLNSLICSISKKENIILNPSLGIYFVNHFNFYCEIRNPGDLIDFSNEFWISGVCDNPEQVMEKHKELLSDPESYYCVVFTQVVKLEEPEFDGWRWEKWGDYIGTKNPKGGYLRDEGDEFEFVYCYRILKLKNED